MAESVQYWLGRSIERPDGTEASIPTQFAAIEVGVERQLAHDATTLWKSSSNVLIVSDKRTHRYVSAVEQSLIEKGFQTHQYIAPDEADGSSPAPEESGALDVARVIQEKSIDWAVSVGSGTINDRTKYAAHVTDIPYMCYATAASMNGYNSPIVAIYVKGLKSTVPARPPVGLYADPEVIVQAPRLMHLAGLGDLCSKPFAGADAIIASILNQTKPWHVPSEMVEDVFEQALQNAERIGKDDPEAITQLMEALWVSGFSMTLAGSSSPASGGEHLWSHRIDMAQHDASQPLRALHGTQVGIACNLVRPLFGALAGASLSDVQEGLQKTLDGVPDPNQESEFEHWLQARHTALSAKSLAPLQKEAAKKYNRGYREQVRTGLVEHWETIQKELQKAHRHAERIAQALQLAGAPQTPEEIGLKEEESLHILTVCRDIRNRFTILDLTAEIRGEEGFN